jgi:zinc D-Ala-D-Ala carboxypeptidase
MRTSIILICLLLSLASCQDTEKDKNQGTEANQTEIPEPKDQLGSSPMDQPINSNKEEDTRSPSEEKETPEAPEKVFTGIYLHNSHPEDASCSCYCIEVKTSGTSELCLKENEIYINARYLKNGENLNIFYSGKSTRTTNKELPWDKFEKETPIAVLTSEGNGTYKLDWKGFSIDGKIAVDYAILGKKTLEGIYKKQ